MPVQDLPLHLTKTLLSLDSLWAQTSLRQLQQELADSLKKLSMSEASLEVNTRYRNDLEEEKARILKDLDRLKGKVPTANSASLWQHILTTSLIPAV